MSEQDRQVFMVKYSTYSFFPIPTGLDLEDETIVESYGVKWDTLHINLKNGKLLKIQSAFKTEPDEKYPDDDEGEILEQEHTPITIGDDEYEKVDELLEKANKTEN